jgi:uncharacterized membrane protein YjjP (DUF1212 family)
MNWIDQNKNNRPLLNSVISGLIYFLFCWSIDFGDTTKGLFMALMLFLPGLTFPLSTCYYKTENISYSYGRRIGHLVLSVAIYHGSVWLFSGEGRIKYITVLAGFLGSLLFLIVTKHLLKKKISFVQILLISILSGLAFLQYEINGQEGLFMGIAVFLWTLVNGLILNIEHRKATYR